MGFQTISKNDPIPAEGEFEIVHERKRFAVVHHPRIPGHWMALTPPANWRDSGMKKYATRGGAVRRITTILMGRDHA